MTLGQKIYKLRTERKWSQEKLTEAVPDVSNAVLLAKTFG